MNKTIEERAEARKKKQKEAWNRFVARRSGDKSEKNKIRRKVASSTTKKKTYSHCTECKLENKITGKHEEYAVCDRCFDVFISKTRGTKPCWSRRRMVI